MDDQLNEHSALFEQLRAIQTVLHQKLTERLTLRVEPPQQPLHHFSNPDGTVTGSLQTATGTPVDWLVYAWLHAPQRGLSTLRLTTWLDASIAVPHLAIELGIFPQVFFYMDYLPRVDLWSDLSYVETYYEPIVPLYLKIRDHSAFSPFVSKNLYIRQIQSPIHLSFTCAGSGDNLSLIQTTAEELCDRWLDWVGQAESVAIEQQPALAERDLRLRRISAERDPGNAAAANLFGQEVAARLVRSLWDRSL